jgi:hypothetical protein
MADCKIVDHKYSFAPRVPSECGYTEVPRSPSEQWRGTPSIPLSEPDWDSPTDGLEARFNEYLHTMNANNREAKLVRRREALKHMLQLREEAINEGMPLRTEDEINHEVARRRGTED